MQPETKVIEKRLFPRIQVRCPLLYRVAGAAQQMESVTVDFSATGVKMACKEALAVKTQIEIEFRPGSNKSVPAMRANGEVTRCEPGEEGEFLIACRFTRVYPLQRS